MEYTVEVYAQNAHWENEASFDIVIDENSVEDVYSQVKEQFATQANALGERMLEQNKAFPNDEQWKDYDAFTQGVTLEDLTITAHGETIVIEADTMFGG